ncbi:MAG: MBL fold metallo-hydrolase [Sphingomonadaceae bacterium]|nr:MBL fold metallo-hydrolase [Sphingomonadaceae bacterium]
MKKRLGWGILALVMVVVAGFALGQRQIGERLFERAVSTTVGVDRTASLPDGLHAYVCGSGSPMPDAERAGPCIAVLAGKRGFVFDAGSGSIRKLGRMGFPMDRLDAAFLTHLHSDHFDGLGELMLQAWMAGGRDTPLPIYGPEGTDRIVAGFTDAYTIDRGYRIAHHGEAVARPGGFGGEARIVPIEAGGVIIYRDSDVTIRALPVDHAPVDRALAYRIDYGGRSLVISGDTVKSDALAKFAKGADVLFHEALNPRMIGRIGKQLTARGNPDAAKIMADIPDYHTSPEDAARVAADAGVRELVLYHLVPAPPARLIERVFLGETRDHFDAITLAQDGMLVSLPAKDKDVIFDDLL